MAIRLKKRNTQDYYDANPEAKAKKAAYDTNYHKTPERRKYRSKLVKARRGMKVYGKGGKDVSHKKDGTLCLESKSKNRARNGADGKSTTKKS